MKTFKTKLVKRDGSINQSAYGMNVDEVLAGIRKILLRDDCTTVYLFRRNPISIDNEHLNTHLRIELD